MKVTGEKLFSLIIELNYFYRIRQLRRLKNGLNNSLAQLFLNQL